MTRNITWLIVLSLAISLTGCGGLVSNPAYEGWEEFTPGSSVTFEGTTTINDFTQRVRMTDTLVAIDANQLTLERREELFDDEGNVVSDVTGEIIEKAEIFGVDSVITHPDTELDELDPIQISVAGRTFECEGTSFTLTTRIPVLQDIFDGLFGVGQTTSGERYTSPAMPGGLVRGRLETIDDEVTTAIEGEIVDFHVVME
jgi:hypothetical protein